jgi:hypothetical protein
MALVQSEKAVGRANMINSLLDELFHQSPANRAWNSKGTKTTDVLALAERHLQAWQGVSQPKASTAVSLVNSLRELCIQIGSDYHNTAKNKYPEEGSQDSDMGADGPLPITYTHYKIIDNSSKSIGHLIAKGEEGGEGFVTFAEVVFDLHYLGFTHAETAAMNAAGYDGRKSEEVEAVFLRKIISIGLSELEAGNMNKGDKKAAKDDKKRKQEAKDGEAQAAALRLGPVAGAAAAAAGGADPTPPKKKAKPVPSDPSDPSSSDIFDNTMEQLCGMFSPANQELQHKRSLELAQAASAPMTAILQHMLGGGGFGAAGFAPPQAFAAPPQPLANLRVCPQCKSQQPGIFCGLCGTRIL